MKYKGENWSGAEVRAYFKERFPGLRVTTNKPYNKGASAIDPDTGVVLLEGKKNFMLIDKATAPDTETLKFEYHKLINMPRTVDLKNRPEKLFTKALSYVIEAMELSGLNHRPRFIVGEDGFPTSIKLGGFEFDLHGMKIKEGTKGGQRKKRKQ